MATVNVDEAEVAEVRPQDTLCYPNVRSCITLTLMLDDNNRLGMHLVQAPTAEQMSPNQAILKFDELLHGRRVKKILVAGDAALSQDESGLDNSWSVRHLGADSDLSGGANIATMLGVYYQCEQSYYSPFNLGSQTGDLEVSNDLQLKVNNQSVLTENVFGEYYTLDDILEDGMEEKFIYHPPQETTKKPRM